MPSRYVFACFFKARTRECKGVMDGHVYVTWGCRQCIYMYFLVKWARACPDIAQTLPSSLAYATNLQFSNGIGCALLNPGLTTTSTTYVSVNK
jgi:hypothetical protein